MAKEGFGERPQKKPIYDRPRNRISGARQFLNDFCWYYFSYAAAAF